MPAIVVSAAGKRRACPGRKIDMTDRYAVVGNPIAHSKSPQIHTAFAVQTGQHLTYERLLAPLDGFVASVADFFAAGGRGLNVTVPFKLEAWQLAAIRTPRATLAEAVNTLWPDDQGHIHGDNTDGAGLVRDITVNQGYPLAGRRILLMGAGGAARGVLLPLLHEQPLTLLIANRTAAKAQALAEHFAGYGQIDGCGYADLAGQQFDLIINATSASLQDELPPLPDGLFAQNSLAYDMMYGKGDTRFLAYARAQGAARLADGLGMLVEQAAEAFFIWRGIRPETTTLLQQLRSA